SAGARRERQVGPRVRARQGGVPGVVDAGVEVLAGGGSGGVRVWRSQSRVLVHSDGCVCGGGGVGGLRSKAFHRKGPQRRRGLRKMLSPKSSASPRASAVNVLDLLTQMRR